MADVIILIPARMAATRLSREATADIAGSPMIVHVQPGANSHIACNQAYRGYEPLPCPTFEDAFAAVRTGRAELAMIPIDNSVAGRVADIHHLMPRSGLHIVGEWFLPVQHQLIAPKRAGPDDQDGRKPRPRARPVPQHHPFVARQGGGRRRHRGRRARGGGSRRRHAGGAGDQARGKNLPPQNPQENVADDKHNTTRFVVLARSPKWASRKEHLVMTTFVFQVRNIPAALYKALGGFATNGVNMTKLESYMVDGNFAATQFYADVQGHPRIARSNWRWRNWNSCRSRSRSRSSASIRTSIS